MQAQRLKKIITLASVLLIISIAVGATVAYIRATTPTIDNEFVPVEVSCAVVETFDGVRKTDVAVKNTGDITAYIRVVAVVTWVSEQDGSLYPAMPTEGVDYSLVRGSDKWVRGSDGYYYYVSSVRSGDTTDILIASLEELSETPDGYRLSVQIAASAVQADPKDAVNTLWGIDLLDNGNLDVK